MARSPGKVMVSTGALVSSHPAARIASAAAACVMPPTSVPQTETFGKMASFFATSTMPTAAAATRTASTMSTTRTAILPPRPRGFFSFEAGCGWAPDALRRAVCSCRGTGWRWGAACFGAAARRAAASLCAERLAPLRCAERSCAAKSAASRRAAALRLEVLPLSFISWNPCLSLSKSDCLNMYRGKPPPRRAGAWCAAGVRSAASSTGCARPCGRSAPQGACR